jgi:hypothetical protein
VPHIPVKKTAEKLATVLRSSEFTAKAGEKMKVQKKPAKIH